MLHLWKHFKTVAKHRHLVFVHCVKAGIPWRGMLHDLSKFSPTEREREVYGYSKAWMHHKGRNKHHFEYWTDYNIVSKKLEPVKMPIKYVKEMFCDRVAAGKVYQGKNYTNDNPINYFLKGRARLAMHPETAELLEKWLRLIQTDGEDAAFAEIRGTQDY